jgi:hypothetical protein
VRDDLTEAMCRAREAPLVGLAPAMGNAILRRHRCAAYIEILDQRHRQDVASIGPIQNFLHAGDFYLSLRRVF